MAASKNLQSKGRSTSYRRQPMTTELAVEDTCTWALLSAGIKQCCEHAPCTVVTTGEKECM